MLGLAVVMLLLILLPFIFNYVQSTILETSKAVAYEEVLAILQSRFVIIDMSNPFYALVKFFAGRRWNSFDPIWYFVWFLGIAGITFGLIQHKNSEDKAHPPEPSMTFSVNQMSARQIAAWLTGVLIVGGLVPIVEQIVFTYLKQLPPEFEILKTLRYLTPLILLASFYALWLASDYLNQKGVLSVVASQYFLVGVSILLLLLWGGSADLPPREFRNAAKQNVSCWLQGKIICPLPQASMDFIEVLDVVRTQTPVGSRIFSEEQEIAVRYYALRPLVFTYKDGSPLAYTDQRQLLLWSHQSERMDKLDFIRKFAFRRRAFVRGIVELAQDTQSEYLLLREPYNVSLYYPEQLALVYSNENYSLYKLTP